MANPRQRRKQKSTNYKKVRTSKLNSWKKPPVIKGPKAIQDAWDAKKTLHQNYAALGLASTLAPAPSGGVEVTRTSKPHTAQNPAGELAQTKPTEYGRIIRDSTGKVVSVELPDASYHSDEEVHVKEFSLDNNISNFGGDQDPWVPDVPAESSKVVRALEDLSLHQSTKPRNPSMHELAWLRTLVAKYGRDIDGMARDRKLNVWQRTPGELRRAITKAGGVEKLTRTKMPSIA